MKRILLLVVFWGCETNQIGEQQCPMESNESCPSDCAPISASPVDETNQCLLPPTPIICTKATSPASAVEVCLENSSTGRRFSVTHDYQFAAPNYVGWNYCTEDMRKRVAQLAECLIK